MEALFDDGRLTLLNRPDSPAVRFDADGDSVLLLSGEIYDLESVCPPGGGGDLAALHRLMRAPDLLDRLPRLNGSFFIVWYDSAAGRLRLVSDRYASRKCYHASRGECFWFFPHVHYFRHAGFRMNTDPAFVVPLLTSGCAIGEQTVLEGVLEMPAGSIVEATREGRTTTRYWRWQFEDRPELFTDVPARARELGDRLVRAVERRVRGKGKVVVTLSGGFDTRAMLGALLELKPADSIVAATYGVPGCFDYDFAARVARRGGVAHHQMDLSKPHDYEAELLRQAADSDGICELVGQVFPSDWERVERHARDVVVGVLGDNVMGGHSTKDPNQPAPDTKEGLLMALREKRRFVRSDIVSRLLRRDEDECERFVLDSIEATNGGNDQRLYAHFTRQWSIPNRSCRLFMLHCYKLRERFNYLSPFLDNDVVDFMRRAPVALLSEHTLYSRMLRKRFGSLFALPTTATSGLTLRYWKLQKLGRKITKFLRRRVERCTFGALPLWTRREARMIRKRIPYLDHEILMRQDTPFQTMCIRALDRVGQRGLFDPDVIRSLWSEHLAGKVNHRRPLVMLITFEFMFEVFADGALPEPT